jgi:hypothetical protein
MYYFNILNNYFNITNVYCFNISTQNIDGVYLIRWTKSREMLNLKF